MSEELEHSLQQAVETYLNERLRSIDEQIERLHTELGEALVRLREQAATGSLDGTAVSAAIFAHLQTARSERLSDTPPASLPSADTASLKQAVQQIEAQQSQADILKALLQHAVRFADRVALFVVKNDQAIGWRLAKTDEPELQMIGGVSLPLTAQTIVTRAARDRVTASGADAADSDYALLLDQLGGAPAAVTAIPLIVRGKVVAVLYADAPSTDANAMDVHALELLTRVAAMAVNVVSIQRTAPTPTAPSEAVTAPAIVQAAEVPQPEVVREETYTPQIESPSAFVMEEAAPAPMPAEAPVETAGYEVAAPSFEAPTHEPVTYTAPEPPPTAQEPVWETPATGTDAISSQIWSAPAEIPPAPEPAPEPPPAEVTAPFAPAESTPAYSSQYSTPLGSSRRSGVSEPELPVDVGEDERRLHNDARRFARLLVSEIKLYNEPKVQEGRSKSDLYDRLRDDIDRSRQMYDKRVAPPVAARHDYFHQELVNTLAEGDVTKLGMSYPGAAVTT
ncbi:MAG TPA: GAF domain-containing protein [Pyrinomonadaceae bacterium]|nr:GAF domain-containing protein [Pyrinomonadaceae bacterium]